MDHIFLLPRSLINLWKKKNPGSSFLLLSHVPGFPEFVQNRTSLPSTTPHSDPARCWHCRLRSLSPLKPRTLFSYTLSPSQPSYQVVFSVLGTCYFFILSRRESLCSKKVKQNRKIILPSFSFSSFSIQVLVQPQIIKTDSLVLTTLKTDGSPVMAAVQNPALTALTTPIQTAALQVPVRVAFLPVLPSPLSSSFLGGIRPQRC